MSPFPLVTFYHDIEQDCDSSASPVVCRQVVRELLALEARHGVRATYNVVGKLFREQPDVVQWIQDAGGEVAFHSYTHPPDWRRELYAAEVERCRLVSGAPKGYRSPRSQWDRSTLASLWEHGFLWSAEDEPATDWPYFIHEGLVRVPVALDDWPVFRGDVSIAKWAALFTRLLKKRRYVAVGSHDSVTSLAPEERLAAWELLLQRAGERSATIVSFSEAAGLPRDGLRRGATP